MRSVNKKVPLVTQLFSDENLDFIFLTETWQPPSIAGKMDVFTSSFLDFSKAEDLNAKLFAKPRPGGRRGGGVAFLSRETFSVVKYKVNFPTPSAFEFLSVKIMGNFNVIFVGLYRPSTGSFSRFIAEFRYLLISLVSINCPCIVAGDFNVKMNDSDDRDTIQFCNLLREYNFVAFCSDSATHRDGNTLDFLVVSSCRDNMISSITADASVEGSDHFPVLFSLDLIPLYVNPERSVKLKTFRNLKSIDDDIFANSLQSRLQPLLSTNDGTFSSYLSAYRNCIVSVLDDLAPIQSRLVSNKNNPPWFDREYIHQKSIRKRLQNTSNKSAYNAQKRYCSYLSTKKRTDFYSALVMEVTSTNNQTLLFKLLNKLTGREVCHDNLPASDDSTELANRFNSFFSQKITDIRQSIAYSGPLPPSVVSESVDPVGTSHTAYCLESFTPTSQDEIRSVLKKHGIKTGPGDVLTPVLIDKHLDILIPHFEKLVNLSMSSSNCDGLKEAHVIPILKSMQLDKEVFKNYRPVSLLSFISKLTERIVHSRINDHLVANSLDNPTQYGYKRNHSCETLLLKLVDDILVATDKKLGVVVMIIDLSAAFDTVDHQLLLNILQNKYRISGSALRWLKSFITGRSQRVRVGDGLSDVLVVLFGVAQGSVLGPLLFNLYCSSIDAVFKSCGFDSMGYADDNIGLRIFPACTSLTNVDFAVPNCLRAIRRWADSHFLKLNSGKTKLMVFGNSSFMSSFNHHTLTTDTGSIIPISRTIKLLGVVLDNVLSFNQYVSDIVSSVNLTLRNIGSIRKFLNRKAVEALVHALVTSKLDACNSLFVGMSRGNFAKLQLLQNAALRCVLNIPPQSHLARHYVDLHWLQVEKRSYFKYIVLIFKCINNFAPVQLSSKLKMKCPINMLLDTEQFVPSSSCGRRSFSYLAPRCWNAMPIELRLITGLEEFKTKLKTFLFTNFRAYLHSVNPYTSVALSQGSEQVTDLFLIDHIFEV